jgi:uncharacterized damage-inducible protein DinB
MDSRTMLRRMAENNAWSNFRLLRACAELTDEEYKARRTSFFPSIHLTLTHIYLVDAYYLDACEGGGLGRRVFQDEAPFEGFAPLRDAQLAHDQRLVTFVAALPDAAAADRAVAIERQHHVQRERLGDVLLHLFQHQIHHRGQAHAMLAGTRAKPPQLDEFFMAEDLPLREAELSALGLPLR